MKSLTIFSIALVALMPSAVLAGPDDPVQFDDENLKQAIKETLGITTDPTEAQMATLAVLNAENREIAHLKGIESAKNLTNLSLRHNDINDIEPLIDLTELIWLDLRDNPLSVESYCCHLPLIEYNNVGIELLFDPPTTIYVDDDAPTGGDGSSWPTAYKYLQDALADADSVEKPVEIRVAEGIYAPDSNSTNRDGTGDREATFQLIDGVIIKGGYAGLGQADFVEVDPNTRDIEAYKSNLSGDLDGNDVDVNDPCNLPNEPSRVENSYHVVSGIDVNETAVLDGFTIEAGNADDSGALGYGGGMYINYGTPTVNNCTYRGNSAAEGGGIYSFGGSPTANNCKFEGNWAGTRGGGMCNIQSGEILTNLTNCIFEGNWAGKHGGGMCNIHSSATLTNCPFRGNSADEGGGMYNDSVTSSLSNCKFSGNSVAKSGGGMYSFASSVKVVDCNISGNSAGESGGGMSDIQSSSTVTNCIFEGNSAEDDGGGMYSKHSNSTLTHCTFRQNTAFDEGGGLYQNANIPPSGLSNCTFSENSADKGGGMYNGWVQNQIVTNCTFRGSSAHNGGGMYNFQSNPTLINCTFNGNTAHSAGGMDNYSSEPTLTNCTFSDNQADNGNALVCRSSGTTVLSNCIVWDGRDSIYSTDASTIIITYSDIEGGFSGVGNIDADPCFADANNGDYHLKSVEGRWDPNSQSWVQDDVNSPCIDTGDPLTCIGFEPNPNGDVVNMGAYGGTAEASLSPSGISCISANRPEYDEWILFGAPACWCYSRQCYGDTDCKSQGKNQYWVSTKDLDILIAAWNKPFTEIEGQTLHGLDLVCADFDHKAQGKNNYRVSTNDLGILIANWNTADTDPNCP